MAEKKTKPETRDHPHEHELVDHVHRYASEEHEHSAVGEHSHDERHAALLHTHGDLQGHLKGAVRVLLSIFEAGAVNSEQRKAIHAVRVIIGDARGNVCVHENVAYEQEDRLICQDCRADVTPEAGG